MPDAPMRRCRLCGQRFHDFPGRHRRHFANNHTWAEAARHLLRAIARSLRKDKP